jgi:hypothetical protein
MSRVRSLSGARGCPDVGLKCLVQPGLDLKSPFNSNGFRSRRKPDWPVYWHPCPQMRWQDNLVLRNGDRTLVIGLDGWRDGSTALGVVLDRFRKGSGALVVVLDDTRLGNAQLREGCVKLLHEFVVILLDPLQMVFQLVVLVNHRCELMADVSEILAGLGELGLEINVLCTKLGVNRLDIANRDRGVDLDTELSDLVGKLRTGSSDLVIGLDDRHRHLDEGLKCWRGDVKGGLKRDGEGGCSRLETGVER